MRFATIGVSSVHASVSSTHSALSSVYSSMSCDTFCNQKDNIRNAEPGRCGAVQFRCKTTLAGNKLANNVAAFLAWHHPAFLPIDRMVLLLNLEDIKTFCGLTFISVCITICKEASLSDILL